MVKWKLVSRILVLACLAIIGMPVMAAGNTDVTGTVPLVNYGVSATNITQTSATISWQTNSIATSQVFYDIAEHDSINDYLYQTMEDPALILEHSKDLIDLSAATTYHYRVRSIATINDTVFNAISGDYTFTTETSGGDEGSPPSSGGGGGGGGIQIPGYTFISYERILPNGTLLTPIVAMSEDENIKIELARSTKCLDGSGLSLRYIRILPMDEIDWPQPPTDAAIIGIVYDFGPNGAIFDPPGTLTVIYDELLISEDVNEEDLVIACWDADAEEWVVFEDCVVDPEENIITVEISHFTPFTVLAYEVAPLAPATFELSSLSISPAEVEIGEEVAISVLVTNSGDAVGSYEVILKIDNLAVATKDVELAGRTSQTVTFTINKDIAGSYEAEIDEQSKTFIVIESPEILLEGISSVTDFTMTDFTITPTKVTAGEIVTISTGVTNTGNLEGAYTLALMINGNVEQMEEVILAPGDNKLVRFEVIKEKVGVYHVEVGGQSGEFTLSPPLFSSNRLLLMLSIMAVIAGIFVVLNRSWLITRLQLKPRLATLNKFSNQDDRETLKNYPLQLQVKSENTTKLAESKISASLESGVYNNYQVWLLNQLEKSKKAVGPEIKVMFESNVQKKCKAWLSDQWHKYELQLSNKLGEDNKSIMPKMMVLFERQVREDYQEWLLDQLVKSKQSVVAQMLTMFEWQVKHDYQEWLLDQLKNGRKPIESKVKTLLEWQVLQDYQVWILDYLEDAERSINVKMMALLHDYLL